ncbi:MAG: YceI family protein, partial [Saprospiraceae bacterium]|nr:YceI family protein [Saprospiraceae bacterium]
KIKSEKGKTMDSKTHEALKSNKNPHITFNATRVQVNGQDVTATGPLSIAGQTRTVTVKGKWRAISANEIEVKGSHAMKMTDFGISPPTALLGTMKTGDGITLQFTVRVKG